MKQQSVVRAMMLFLCLYWRWGLFVHFVLVPMLHISISFIKSQLWDVGYLYLKSPWWGFLCNSVCLLYTKMVFYAVYDVAHDDLALYHVVIDPQALCALFVAILAERGEHDYL